MFFQIIILVVKIILSNTQQPLAQCGGKKLFSFWIELMNEK
jgi:hypothetical protein